MKDYKDIFLRVEKRLYDKLVLLAKEQREKGRFLTIQDLIRERLFALMEENNEVDDHCVDSDNTSTHL